MIISEGKRGIVKGGGRRKGEGIGQEVRKEEREMGRRWKKEEKG